MQLHSIAAKNIRDHQQHHKYKKSSRSRHGNQQADRYSNARIHSTNKRSHKNSQNSSPANLRQKHTKATSSKPSKSQGILPPPILTSTLQLQPTSSSFQDNDMNSNYVNIPQQVILNYVEFYVLSFLINKSGAKNIQFQFRLNLLIHLHFSTINKLNKKPN